MSKYRVYQDGKRCSDYNIKTWDIDTFDTLEEAQLFAAYWAFPVSKEAAKDYVRPMELNVPVDMGYTEVAVMMEIREVLK